MVWQKHFGQKEHQKIYNRPIPELKNAVKIQLKELFSVDNAYTMKCKISIKSSVSIEYVAFFFTFGLAFIAMDFPQYSNTGISVEPSPTAMQLFGKILFSSQKALKQFTLSPALIYELILPVNIPSTTS